MRKLYFLLACLMLVSGINAQTLQGDATTLPPSIPGSTDYQLTAAATFQRGAYWNNVTVDLTSNFSVTVQLNFGDQTGPTTYPASHETTSGADGIAFVLQSVGTTALGDFGEGMGYGSIAQSFAVEMDTWQNDQFGPNPINRFDPAEDHLAFMKNGDVTHNTAANSNANLYTLANLEDGLWHTFTASWNAGAQTLTITLDGVSRSFTGNLPMIIGNGGPAANIVTWGFTAATGAAVNRHRVRFAPACAPFTVSASVPALGCSNGNTIYLGYGPQTVTAVATPAGPATTYIWYKVGTPDVQVANTATFAPTSAGTYYVTASRGANCTATTKDNPALVTTVIDIRCGKENQNKVYVCHKQNGVHGNGTIGDNAHTLCVSVSAVPAHLAHGDCLGSCESNGLRMNAEQGDQQGVTINSVYPNPTAGNINVKLENENNSRSEIMIRNAQGNLVETRNVSGNAVQSFDLRKYGTGVFLIQVKTGSSISTKKVLVQE